MLWPKLIQGTYSPYLTPAESYVGIDEAPQTAPSAVDALTDFFNALLVRSYYTSNSTLVLL